MKSLSWQKVLQIVISVAMLGILVYVAIRNDVAKQVRAVNPLVIVLAVGVVCAAWLINALRWSMLLKAAGAPVAWVTLARVYFVGMFFSMMLPTGAGGDAVRMWDITRRTGNGAAVIVATLQERLLGMGVAMVVGLVGVLTHLAALPVALRPLFIIFPSVGALACASALNPRVAFYVPRVVWGRMSEAVVARVSGMKFCVKAGEMIRRMEALPGLSAGALAGVVAVTLAGVLTSFFVCKVLAWGMGARVTYGELCVAIPLVWVIAMTPSIGGLGVREGALAGFLILFKVPKDQAIAIAALNLVANLCAAGMGGFLVAMGTLEVKRAEQVVVASAD